MVTFDGLQPWFKRMVSWNRSQEGQPTEGQCLEHKSGPSFEFNSLAFSEDAIEVNH